LYYLLASQTAERKNKVLIIDASALFRKGRAQNFLDPEHGEQIVKWFQAFEDAEDRAKVVTLRSFGTLRCEDRCAASDYINAGNWTR
jgi:type I restriction-modification system DNA methylase subunit